MVTKEQIENVKFIEATPKVINETTLDTYLIHLRKYFPNTTVYLENKGLEICIEYNTSTNDWHWIEGGNSRENYYTLYGILTELCKKHNKNLVFIVNFN